MNQLLEIKVIKKYIVGDKQSRYIQFVSSQNKRYKFVNELPHFKHFRWELLDEVHKDEAREIYVRLKALSITRSDCYVISENPAIDQKTISLEIALERIRGLATLLVFEDAELVYFEGEPPGNRYITKVH